MKRATQLEENALRGGTLQLQVAGANRGQYDTLNVGDNAKLNGVLQLISLWLCSSSRGIHLGW